MADLEKRVDDLEKEVSNIKLELNTSLNSIQADVSIIKERIMGSNENNGLQNELIKKDIDTNSKRISKLEENQSKLVWTVIGQIIALIGGAIIAYIKTM